MGNKLTAEQLSKATKDCAGGKYEYKAALLPEQIIGFPKANIEKPFGQLTEDDVKAAIKAGYKGFTEKAKTTPQTKL